LALVWACGAIAEAVPLPDGPRLAFLDLSTLKPQGFAVKTVGPEISRPLVVVRGSRHGVVPHPFDGLTWSADGNRLAFTASRGNGNGIYAVRADGTGLRFLRGTKGGSNPIFSPDGSKIAFTREHLGKGFFLGTTPWVAAVDGTRAHPLAEWREGVEYRPSSFSPDGSVLAVTKTRFATNESVALLLRLDGSGGIHVLDRRGSEPAFSPDGSQIAFVHHSISRRWGIEIVHRDLFVASIDGTRLRRLTDTYHVSESHPSWDPSGHRIAFNSFRISKDPIDVLFDELLPSGNSIAQVNADGTCRERILRLRNSAIFGAVWRPGLGRETGPIDC
jgi:Tol biopolymer transport system component